MHFFIAFVIFLFYSVQQNIQQFFISRWNNIFVHRPIHNFISNISMLRRTFSFLFIFPSVRLPCRLFEKYLSN